MSRTRVIKYVILKTPQGSYRAVGYKRGHYGDEFAQFIAGVHGESRMDMVRRAKRIWPDAVRLLMSPKAKNSR